MAAANTDKFMEVGSPGTATTLAAPGHSIGGTTINVVSTTNWPTATGVAFAIDRVELVNGVATQVAGSYTEWVGVVSGAGTISNMTLTYGTDVDYASGSLTRVYIPVAATHENRLVQGIVVQHKQDGTHANTITTDTVNENTSAHGVIIDSMLFKDGTPANWDGWVIGNETWTYVSATTFKVSGTDVTAKYPVGTKLKLTQTTVKYFYVVATSFSTDTTITVAAGSDYSLANAAITSPFYSYMSTPQGFPNSFNFTATPLGFSGSPTTTRAVFSMTGKWVRGYIAITGTSNATSSSFTLPVTGTGTAQYYTVANSTDNGAGVTTGSLFEFVASSTTCNVYKDQSGANWTNTGTKAYRGHFEYEAA